jgi:MFS family permease
MILCVAGLVGIFSSTISKSPVLPLFASQLGASPAGVGLVAGVSAFTGVLFSLPAGLLSDRWGRRSMLMLAAGVFASAPFLYLLVGDIGQLALVRFYHGLATAIFLPVAMALVADLFQAGRGEKIGWFSTATLLGRFMAPLAGGALLSGFGLEGGAGFTAVYLVCGLAGLAMLGLSLKLPRPAARQAQTQDWSATWTAFRRIVSNRGIVVTSLVEAGVLFSYGIFEVFMPLHARRWGQAAWQIGLCLSAQVLALAFSKPLFGRLSDRHGRPRQIMAGALAAGLGIAIFPWCTEFFSLLAASILLGLALSVVTSASSAFIADLSHDKGRGSAMGLLGSLMDIGHTTGPILGGLAATWTGLALSFWLGAGVLACAAGVFWALVMGRGQEETT